jgi:hypothetical protein
MQHLRGQGELPLPEDVARRGRSETLIGFLDIRLLVLRLSKKHHHDED